MKRMLFNATQAEELRVAIVDGQKLIDLDIESAAKEQRKSNIYKGVITRIEPSLEACFVNYGEERHGFLPFKEVSRSYFAAGVDVGRARINEALREGQEILVQVDKDERGNKGAALTTYISLAGRYLVLMPNNPRGGGVSRRVEGDERSELRDIIDQLTVPQGMSLIARTAAIGRSAEELQWDLNYLMQLWGAIEGASGQQSGPFLIYLEGSLVIRAIRDYFQPEIGEILIDTEDVYEQARAFMGTVMPQNVNCVKFYRDDVPLFSRFQIEHQIESAYSRQVNLPSGGAVVIDHTEALVSVDVNSGRATKGSDIEETALRTNLEAADELARQLRLRDLGGLIVIDFIDMESQKNQREVENRLRDALRYDRARVQTGKISRFGLLELSRQRLRPALAETSYITCPRCTGTGHIRSTESAALHILRILEEEAMKESTGAVHAQMPVDVATFLLNEKRTEVAAIELRHKVNILLIPNIHLETPQHTIERLRHDDLNNEDRTQPSYKMATEPDLHIKLASAQQDAGKPRQEAAIKQFTPEQPAPQGLEKKTVAAAEAPSLGLFARIARWFSGNSKAEATPAKAPAGKGRRERSEGGQRDGRRGERGDRNRNDRNRGERNRGDAKVAGGERDARDGKQEQTRGRQSARRDAPQEARSDVVGTEEKRAPRNARPERAPRPEKAERQEAQRRDRTPTPTPSETNNVGVSQDAPPLASTLEATEPQESGRGRRNRRGRRGGERRPDGANAKPADNASVDTANEPVAAAASVIAAAASAGLQPVVAAQTTPVVPTEVQEAQTEAPATEAVDLSALAPVTPPPASPDSAVATPVLLVQASDAPMVEPRQERATAQPVPEPVAVAAPAPAAPAPVVPTAPAPVVSIDEILKSSGLTMVETSEAQKLALAQTAQAHAEVQERPRRKRPVPVPVMDEPLQQVETVHKG